MSKLAIFRPRRELIARKAAAVIQEQLALFGDEDVPPTALAAVLNALRRVTHPDSDQSIWSGSFMMLSKVQCAAVWDAIRALPPTSRPQQVRHAFDLVLLNLRQDTGEIMLTRAELAEKVGCDPDNITRVMGTLEKMGVIRKERRPFQGTRGAGLVVYFINPHVAWNGSLNIRFEEAQQVAPPLLTLMEGGVK